MANWWDKNLTDKQKFRLQEPKDPSLLDVVSTVPNPVGDVASGLLAAQDLSKGNYGTAALNSLGLLPFIPSMGAVVKNVGKSAKTEFELAQDLAQQRASLPVAEGGLGLPASNTAMDRAKAMGFNTKVYHGTTKAPEEGIRAFDLNLAGKQTGNPNSVLGVFATPNPIEASRYTKDFGKQEYPSVYPLMIKTGKQYEMPYSEADNLAMQLFYNKENPKALALQKRNELLNEGYDSIKVKINPDEIVSMNPSNVRSVNAAFDPFRRNEADILAGVGVGVPVASGLLDIENKKVPNKEKKKTK